MLFYNRFAWTHISSILPFTILITGALFASGCASLDHLNVDIRQNGNTRMSGTLKFEVSQPEDYVDYLRYCNIILRPHKKIANSSRRADFRLSSSDRFDIQSDLQCAGIDNREYSLGSSERSNLLFASIIRTTRFKIAAPIATETRHDGGLQIFDLNLINTIQNLPRMNENTSINALNSKLKKICGEQCVVSSILLPKRITIQSDNNIANAVILLNSKYQLASYEINGNSIDIYIDTKQYYSNLIGAISESRTKEELLQKKIVLDILLNYKHPYFSFEQLTAIFGLIVGSGFIGAMIRITSRWWKSRKSIT
jgi:hypothetical protein